MSQQMASASPSSPSWMEGRMGRSDESKEPCSYLMETSIALVAAGNLDALEQHLVRHPDLLFETDQEKRTLLHIACEQDSPEIASMLICAGCRVNAQDSKQESPMHVAARKNLILMTSVLLRARGDPNCIDWRRRTPLHTSCEKGNFEISQMLLECESDPNIKDWKGRLPIHYACLHGYEQVVGLLVEYGSALDVADQGGIVGGHTPVYYAAANSLYDTVALLISRGAPQHELCEQDLNIAKKHIKESQKLMRMEEKRRKQEERAQMKAKMLLEREKKKRQRYLKRLDEEQELVPAPTGTQHGTMPSSSTVWVTKDGREKIRPCVIAESTRDLPSDIQRTIARMCLDDVVIQRNLQYLLNVLSFRDRCRPKRVFLTPAMYREIRYGAKEQNVGLPSMLLTEEEAFDATLNLKDAKKMISTKEALGAGGFGQVFIAKLTNTSLFKFPDKRGAVKIVQHTSDKELLTNLKEISFLKYLKHPNVCGLYGAFLVGEEAWLVEEFMRGGTLKQAAAMSSDYFSESDIAYVARELITGIHFIHERQLAHRDLKNSNIMLTLDGKIKIIDFGLCCDMSQGPVRHMVGSPFWMAPEMIRMEYHSYPVDVWSFAVSLIELANKRPPNWGNSRRAMFCVATEGLGANMGLRHPERWSDDMKDFLSGCLVVDQTQRATTGQLLKHPFLKKASSDEKMQRLLYRIFAEDKVRQLYG